MSFGDKLLGRDQREDQDRPKNDVYGFTVRYRSVLTVQYAVSTCTVLVLFRHWKSTVM